ncbi:MAG: MarR family transcriptional regulator [Propionicimonas sp.]|uniref:MarR family winged helix-turn-helix transcriptional regulator n=1 Tax=Propionicimonas sp. TaxID=1955623 RepID=UPI003D14902D
MTEEEQALRMQSSQFAEMLELVWRKATLASRSSGNLPALTPSQALALRRVISAETGITPTELASDMELSRPGVSELIGKLEENGLVSRRRSEVDGRSMILTPTERGLYVFHHFRSGIDDAVNEAFSTMSRKDVKRLVGDLPALAHLLDRLTGIAEREESAAGTRSNSA